MVRIRRMNVNDINVIVNYENEIFGISLGYDMIYFDIMENPFARYFVLEKNNNIIGYIGTWSSDNKGQIINFFIVPKEQKKGYGKDLLDYVLENFRLINVTVVTLEVRVSNKSAIGLYKSRGFVEALVKGSYYHDGEDALLLIKYF